MKQVTEMTIDELKGEFDYNNKISLIPDLPDSCPHRRRDVEDEYASRMEASEEAEDVCIICGSDDVDCCWIEDGNTEEWSDCSCYQCESKWCYHVGGDKPTRIYSVGEKYKDGYILDPSRDSLMKKGTN